MQRDTVKVVATQGKRRQKMRRTSVRAWENKEVGRDRSVPADRLTSDLTGRRLLADDATGTRHSSVASPTGEVLMPLPWVRLDTSMPDHPKILDLIDGHKEGRAAAFVWVCSLAYSGKHGTDGFIPRGALSRCNGRPNDAKLLVSAGLWKDEGVGWTIHGWDDYQESTEETRARSEKARHAAFARWHKEAEF